MAKYVIFNPDKNFVGIARTDAIKDKFLALWTERNAITITDAQFDKLKRKLANVTYNGSDISYTEINPLPEKTFTKDELLIEIDHILAILKAFNVNNANDLTRSYQDKINELYLRAKESEDITVDFPNINNSYTFENWYSNQEGFPDFYPSEIY